MAIHVSVDESAIAAFCHRNHIRKLALFGSVLRDDFSPESDVDVLVEFEPGHVPGYAFIGIQEELAAIMGRPVDLSTAGFLSPYIRDRIVREAHTLYVAN
ncbi:MAG: nucleotidyltransferase [Chloroflexota bacterium]